MISLPNAAGVSLNLRHHSPTTVDATVSAIIRTIIWYYLDGMSRSLGSAAVPGKCSMTDESAHALGTGASTK